MKKIKIAIAEDNNRLALAIREKLQLFEDQVDFMYRAANGVELLQQLEQAPAVNVILMDIEMPQMDGIKATAKINEKYPEIKIIMLTVFDDEEKIFHSIQAGAAGYLLKDEPPQKIIESIQMIMAGGAPMSPSIAVKTLKLLKEPFNSSPNEKSKMDFTLSKRENEVLEELCKGDGYQQIAETLFIAPSTVRKHIENIYKKLQVRNKIQAIEKARSYNLL